MVLKISAIVTVSVDKSLPDVTSYDSKDCFIPKTISSIFSN